MVMRTPAHSGILQENDRKIDFLVINHYLKKNL